MYDLSRLPYGNHTYRRDTVTPASSVVWETWEVVVGGREPSIPPKDSLPR